jgi:uncharacterized RDD family membrane protein YckC
MARQPDENPYQSPAAVADAPARNANSDAPTVPLVAGKVTSGRFLAAQLDNGLAVVLFLAVAMNSAERLGDVLAGASALATYLGYYFFPEWLLGTTLGKWLFSLRVRQVSGAPCTGGQIMARTLLRLFEVNPGLLGGLPAGIAILATERKQRLGDLLAGTIVVAAEQSPRAPRREVRIVRR